MNSKQKTKTPVVPLGTERLSASALTRKTPESNGLLDKIDSSLKEDTSQKAKKKRILERCGCF